ncbi:MAG: hypothetical protein UT30_C0008G0006 [Candidatus Uhrbacteria bacterium GW2011_GWF2_39_13]|uniref:Uncharacterized protein n=1 Tax=Candidatus Uhrbacteria bacterium GW2011_GWF2_39_13 TaxID=1618995 RepID=A0A0G0MK22_9BACT|nr:MAG: hypothetical protein UT30_C0008G0006 [Candidatus Uhrbacteria bacterium GW2011_GWF2_39_13]
MSTFEKNIDDACDDLNKTVDKFREQLKNNDEEARAKFTEHSVIEWQARRIGNLERGVGVAIIVVDQSKDSFKSKPLKELKNDLTILLKEKKKTDVKPDA